MKLPKTRASVQLNICKGSARLQRLTKRATRSLDELASSKHCRRPELLVFAEYKVSLCCLVVTFSQNPGQAMQKPGLYLVIGGKSLGKTKIMQKMDQVVAAYSPLLYVNMRHPPQPESTDALECLQAKAKDLWSAKYVPPWAGTVAGVMISLARVVGKESLKEGDAEGGVELAFSELLNVPKPQEFLWAFVDAAVSMKQIPTMIIDEANIAFPNTNGNGDSKSKREAASRALATFVAMTKESCKACVILPASDFAFPWGLQTLGFNKFDTLQTIVIPEVEREPMLALLTEWGLPRDVAEERSWGFWLT